MKIGVFDSGIGGKSVALAIQNAMPDAELLVREDKENLPYGNKTPEQLLALVAPILQSMTDEGCQVIVVACNTVSTTIIGQLQQACSVPLVPVEPMVEEASEQTQTDVIAVCATPSTLASDRYQKLKDTYAQGLTVYEPDCSEWASMIQDNEVDHAKISLEVGRALKAGADVIVLGCTHYHWIEDDIRALCADRAVVIQPEQKIIDDLQQVLARLS